MSRSPFPIQFIIVFGLFWLVAGGILLLALPKGEAVLWFQEHGTDQLDRAFKYITQLGEAPFIIAMGILMLFQRVGAFVLITIASVLDGLLIQFLKKMVFADAARPKLWFATDGITINQVLDVSLNSYNAMPSGHTAAAFTVFTCLGIVSRNTTAQAIFFLVAILVGVSRMYLAQHFYEDVYFGALVGMAVALGAHMLMVRQGWWAKSWAQQPVQKLLLREEGR